MEEEQKDDEDLSTNIKEYLENSPYQVHDSRTDTDEGRY